MATTYKTPGVYVEEIPKLPPSVAQVETALPAFIGYTAKYEDLSTDDLLNKPKRIGSLVEFEQYFGGGPAPEVTEVNIDGNNKFVSAKLNSKFFLYDALQMFYANGGGDCFIVSVGKNRSGVDIDKEDFIKGINALEKEDDPTILLFPDAVTLSDTDLAAVQQAALKQCEDLQDRFSLFDVKQADPLGANFRNNIGINSLKYGAVYTPWLKVNLPKTVKFTDVKSVIKRSGIGVDLKTLSTDSEVLAQIEKTEQAYADLVQVKTKTNTLYSSYEDLSARFAALLAAFNAPSGNSNANLAPLFGFVYSIGNLLDDFINGPSADKLKNSEFSKNLKGNITSNFDPLFAKVASLDREAGVKIGSYNTDSPLSDFTSDIDLDFWAEVNNAVDTAVDPTDDITGDDDEKRRISVVNLIQPLFNQINTAYLTHVVNAASSNASTFDKTLALSFPVYKAILTGVANSMTVMPPSGAVAGAYAMVDRTRGVWKAPANVSLNNVIGPDAVFTASQLENLNVDTVAGKSVNAIRFFTGKGTLIFGARTLAGNDNEWRYVSVRRFFNMVEESCKKATEPFVFEPNDANTWVKIQGMIENFLITLWRQGALQGIKPEHAFYVAVGLGKTMTALDILEGRLIVEIGMAVVRPAEFIILRFSHKMAES